MCDFSTGTTIGFHFLRHDNVSFCDKQICSTNTLLHSQASSRNMQHISREIPVFVSLLLCFHVKESEFISRTMCPYAPGGGLLIANQKLCFHSDCLSPLWQVFSVVTKTTIQQWQMNVAHS